MPWTFQEWLDFYGAERLAKTLKVSPRVVNHWRLGDGWPRIRIILEIVKLSRGKLTVESVIESTWPESKRRARK